MSAPSPLINVMVRAAQKAAKGLRRDFGEVEHLQVSRKGPADFVSTADKQAQRVLREELGNARPSFGFLGEEDDGATATARAGSANAPAERWIVDPLDGTSNFLHGLPCWAISIGAERAGELIAGVVYNPILDEMFWAEKGLGAYLNNRRLRVSARANLDDCLIATGIPFKGSPRPMPEFLAQMAAVMPHVAGIRRWGAASLDLAYVAAGRFDGFWEQRLWPWDIAAGLVLVREAGGFVSPLVPEENVLQHGSLLASNGGIHADLLARLRNAPTKADRAHGLLAD